MLRPYVVTGEVHSFGIRRHMVRRDAQKGVPTTYIGASFSFNDKDNHFPRSMNADTKRHFNVRRPRWAGDQNDV